MHVQLISLYGLSALNDTVLLYRAAADDDDDDDDVHRDLNITDIP